MTYRVINATITNVMSSVTDGTINIIQSAEEPIKKQLIARYCGRLSTWETSWFSVLKEGQFILEAHDAYPGHWLSPAPAFSAFTSVSEKKSVSATENIPNNTIDRKHRNVSAINKVLERHNLIRKRQLQ